jgi:hypothetical protein
MRLVWWVLVITALAAGTGCGSASSATATAHTPATHLPAAGVAPVVRARHAATIHLAQGRQTATLTIPEPDGVILLYRISAPTGARVRATAQLPSRSAPLPIGTMKVGPTSTCHTGGERVTCTVGEEWCPMPAGTWHVRLHKVGGPGGSVTVWFDVGRPPTHQAT